VPRPPAARPLGLPKNISLRQKAGQPLPHGGRRNLHFFSKLRYTQRPALPQQIDERNV
jgi:hypothetical protein